MASSRPEDNSWIAALPNDCTSSAYATAILDAAGSGLLRCDWLPIKSQARGHTATIYVSDDALHITRDDGSRFRPQASARLLQQCADVLHAMLLTSHVADLAYWQSDVVLRAVTMPPGADMKTTAKSVAYNALVEAKRQGKTGLVRDVGKDWILSNRTLMGGGGACNYGQRDSDPHVGQFVSHSGLRVVQPKATAHNNGHTDETQVMCLMLDECEIDGVVRSVSEAAASDELYELFSDEEAPLRVLRQK